MHTGHRGEYLLESILGNGFREEVTGDVHIEQVAIFGKLCCQVVTRVFLTAFGPRDIDSEGNDLDDVLVIKSLQCLYLILELVM